MCLSTMKKLCIMINNKICFWDYVTCTTYDLTMNYDLTTTCAGSAWTIDLFFCKNKTPLYHITAVKLLSRKHSLYENDIESILQKIFLVTKSVY